MATASAYYSHDDTFDRNRRLRRMAAVATLMDTAVTIPFTRIRFGADSVLGLAPGLGDAAGAAISLVLVNEARRLGLPKEKLLGMLLNVGIDTFGGSVPILGDLFDVYFKANKRNVDIVLDHFGMTRDDLARTRI
ncbi:hypothetical protein A6U86_32765 [Rhizobium sp. AC27/96]|uniref:DUF4112 domain-containing protein n=1 Tax=Rhizobium TaxID=379 RepID=UPI0008275BEB|nr:MULTISPECIES: DUF4112 domain-containing protein [Rhizobium]NTF46605.1 DUF4112 domain-containing protein [Rhizobium rhizogenes]OCI99607.1 hypothetical protein A6U86_32765 [Rhizobium sp. AC27/96]